MADIRPLAFPPVRPAAQPPQNGVGSPGRAEALQAARRAFFDAAMQQANAPSSVSAPAPEPAKPVAAPVVTDTPLPSRYPRPGSRLDIKV